MPRTRRLPVGVELIDGGEAAHFRIWASGHRRVEVALESGFGAGRTTFVPLEAEAGGYFSGSIAGAKAGTRYRFRLDGEGPLYPDPVSRFQPEGVHGPSEIIDPGDYVWHDSFWEGIGLDGQILYEMHIGTFTPEGTFAGALAKLPKLAEVGITALEIMPVNEFVGRFGWGYDGVALFAPTRLYGRPDDFRRFVDEAHSIGLGVILDVVYNHFGPTGNYVGSISRDYFSTSHKTDWGQAINFDGIDSASVRELFISNAGYWIEEFHLDGLRIDAMQAIYDESSDPIIGAVTRRVREASGGRKTIVTGENELQDARSVTSAHQGGLGMDAVWNDDFHHAARVAATGRRPFYYGDYRGRPQELVSAVRWGYLYQGQWNARQARHRGTPAWGVSGKRFIIFLQNHDQVANSGNGFRLHLQTSPGRHRALTALLLLSPGTPLLFQGQEFSASAPFFYFADHEVDIAKLVREGREEFLRQFECLAGPDFSECFVDPGDPRTFEQSKLDWSERDRHLEAVALHRDLIRLRREDPVFSSQRADRIHGAVIGAEAFALRFFGEADQDRLLIVNLGCDLVWSPMAEPLSAPPWGADWSLLWSSEDAKYGGSGAGALDTKHWWVAGHAASVLCPQPR